MKNFVLRFFTYLGILYLVSSWIEGFELQNVITTMTLAAMLALTHLVIKPLINFFTFPINFLTFGLFNSILSSALLYIYRFFISGFVIVDGSIRPIESAIIEVPQIKLSEIGVILIASFLISFLNAIVTWTQD